MSVGCDDNDAPVIYAEIKKTNSLDLRRNKYLNYKKSNSLDSRLSFAGSGFGYYVNDVDERMPYETSEFQIDDWETYIDMSKSKSAFCSRQDNVYETYDPIRTNSSHSLSSSSLLSDESQLSSGSKIEEETYERKDSALGLDFKGTEHLEDQKFNYANVLSYENVYDDNKGRECEIFQAIHFDSKGSKDIDIEQHLKIKESGALTEGVYEPLNKRHSFEIEPAKEIKSVPLVTRPIPKARNRCAITNKKEQDETYETMQCKTQERNNKDSKAGASSTAEVNEGVGSFSTSELKNRPRIPSPECQKKLNIIINENKNLSDSELIKKDVKADGQHTMIFAHHYEEVLNPSSKSMENLATDVETSHDYLDLIASYEDIKIVQIQNALNASDSIKVNQTRGKTLRLHSAGSLMSSNNINGNCQKAFLKQRSKSETNFNVLPRNRRRFSPCMNTVLIFLPISFCFLLRLFQLY